MRINKTLDIHQMIQTHLRLENFDFILKNEWASTAFQYRQLIRNFIFENISRTESVLQLDKKPTINGQGISISHNKNCGGFFTTSETSNIGFDIETTHRLNDKTMCRFSTNESEMLNAPSAAYLWTAKEAAFKALPIHEQPTVIAEIEIGDWLEINHHIFTCRILRIKNKTASDSKGLVIRTINRTVDQTVNQTVDQTMAFFKIAESISCVGF